MTMVTPEKTKEQTNSSTRSTGISVVTESPPSLTVASLDEDSRMVNRDRTLILNGAARVFGKLGYGNCTEVDIIAEAGVTPEVFASEFGSKLAVFNAVEEMFNFSLTQAVRGSLEVDGSASLEDLLDAYLRWITVWRDLAHTMWADPSRPYSNKSRDTRDSAVIEFTAVLERIPEVKGTHLLDPVLILGLVGAIREISLAMLRGAQTNGIDIDRAHQAIEMIVRGTLVLRVKSTGTQHDPL